MPIENPLLQDLEDHLARTYTDFQFVGEGDIDRISAILGQHRYNNIIYVGPSGNGKSANLYGIVQRRASTIDPAADHSLRLPLHMIDRRFMLLDTNTLFDTNDPEAIEASIKRVFVELDKPGDHVLVIEDANDLLRGIQENQVSGFLSALVRELKRGSFQAIFQVAEGVGNTKLNEVLNCHSEIPEIFTVLEKDSPSKADCIEILARTKGSLEAHYDGLHIDEDANEEITSLTHQYPNLKIYMRSEPARSLRMRDRIASSFVTKMQSEPRGLSALKETLETMAEANPERPKIEGQIADLEAQWNQRAADLGKAYAKKRHIENQLEQLERSLEMETEALSGVLAEELDRPVTQKDMDAFKTQEIRDLERSLRVGMNDLEAATEATQAMRQQHNEQLTLKIGDVRAYFSDISGIPTKDLTANEAAKALGLGDRLKTKIFGQDDAVDTIADAIVTAKAGLNNPDAPIGSFIAVGSSGTGKTYSAECLAEDLFDDVDALTVFDMSEFMEKHTVARLIGAPPGYAGYGEGGMLTNTVRHRPYQVILLDEIEKAHPAVFKILLQVLDKGRLSDELGSVDFKNTVFIMTTNLGQQLSFEADKTSENANEEIKDAVRTIFPQELINRVDAFLLFKALSSGSVERIVDRLIDKKNKNLAEQEKQLEIRLPKPDISALVQAKYRQEEGARQVQNLFRPS